MTAPVVTLRGVSQRYGATVALELALQVADGADGGGAVVFALRHGGQGLAFDSGCHLERSCQGKKINEPQRQRGRLSSWITPGGGGR